MAFYLLFDRNAAWTGFLTKYSEFALTFLLDPPASYADILPLEDLVPFWNDPASLCEARYLFARGSAFL